MIFSYIVVVQKIIVREDLIHSATSSKIIFYIHKHFQHMLTNN